MRHYTLGERRAINAWQILCHNLEMPIHHNLQHSRLYPLMN